jgi:hypothetical protein
MDARMRREQDLICMEYGHSSGDKRGICFTLAMLDAGAVVVSFYGFIRKGFITRTI